MDAPSLWATCILPGCKQPIADELDVCTTCRTAFGDYLHETDRPPSYTVADLEERDAGIRNAYRSLYGQRRGSRSIRRKSGGFGVSDWWARGFEFGMRCRLVGA
ncbi:hypothetical protein [Rhodococcus pyridinivorans]